ncbi:hypothetical protein CAC42_122 [Sphaceloma murrayae]|uniref:BRCT domain-containing protein n=1 Tax=Sphaceloma murrayae TaxID=2082308 RepID=A0A2K1QMM2_9PEZI|nr:hypothetical protein CAC42_122 [Sphaceloma murrayae]
MPKATCMSGMSFALAGTFEHGWEFDSLRRWITLRGGSIEKRLTPDTTHLIVHSSAINEKPRAQIIDQALRRPHIIIITDVWMEKFLDSNSPPGGRKNIAAEYDVRQMIQVDQTPGKSPKAPGKSPKAPGRYPKAQQTAQKQGTKAQIAAKMQREAEKLERQNQKDGPKPRKKRSRSSLINELDDHVSKYVTALDRRRKPKTRTGLMADAKKFQHGKRVAKQELLSDGYHLFTDYEGFVYEIDLTRVQKDFNINQKLTIRIYESDQEPTNYAVTKLLTGFYVDKPKSEAIVNTGAAFAAAFAGFKRVFKEHTGRDWDNRMNFFTRRSRPALEHSNSGRKMDFVTQSPNGKVITPEQKESFLQSPFSWRAPYEGSVGVTTPFFPGATDAVVGAENAAAAAETIDVRSYAEVHENGPGDCTRDGAGIFEFGRGQSDNASRQTHSTIMENHSHALATTKIRSLFGSENHKDQTRQTRETRGNSEAVTVYDEGVLASVDKSVRPMLTIPQQPTWYETSFRNPRTQMEQHLSSMASLQKRIKTNIDNGGRSGRWLRQGPSYSF